MSILSAVNNPMVLSIIASQIESSELVGKAASKAILVGQKALDLDDAARGMYLDAVGPIRERIERGIELFQKLGAANTAAEEQSIVAEMKAISAEVHNTLPAVAESIATVADADDAMPTADIDAAVEAAEG